MSGEEHERSGTVFLAELHLQALVTAIDGARSDDEKLTAIQITSDTLETLCQRFGVNQTEVSLTSPRKLRQAAVTMSTLADATNVRLTGDAFRDLALKEAKESNIPSITQEVMDNDQQDILSEVDSPTKHRKTMRSDSPEESDGEGDDGNASGNSNYSPSSARDLESDDMDVILERTGTQSGRKLPTNPESSIGEAGGEEQDRAPTTKMVALARAQSLVNDTDRRIQGLRPITMGFDDEFGVQEITLQRNTFFQVMLDTPVNGTKKMSLNHIQQLTDALFVECMGRRLLTRIRRVTEQVNSAGDLQDYNTFQELLRVQSATTAISELSTTYQLIAACCSFEQEKLNTETSDLVYLTNLLRLYETYNALQERLRVELEAGDGDVYEEALRLELTIPAEARKSRLKSNLGLLQGQNVQSAAKKMLLSAVPSTHHNKMDRQLTHAAITNSLVDTYGNSALITFPWNFPASLSSWGVGDGREGRSLSVLLKVLNERVPVLRAQADLLNHRFSDPYSSDEIVPLRGVTISGSSQVTFADRIMAAEKGFLAAAEKARKESDGAEE